MKYIHYLVFIFLAFAVGCKKSDNEPVKLPPTNFQPTTAYSMWNYSTYPNISLYTIKMTGIDSTFKKKKYKEVFSTTSGISWFRQDGGSYYQLLPFNDTVYEFCYLKHDAPVGTQWSVRYTINGVDTKYQYRVMEYDQPKLVFGQVYSHCIRMKQDVYMDFGTGDSLMVSEDYTYANDVGLIYVDKGVNGSVFLKSFVIK